MIPGALENERQDLVGLVSSYMIIEDYNNENAN